MQDHNVIIKYLSFSEEDHISLTFFLEILSGTVIGHLFCLNVSKGLLLIIVQCKDCPVIFKLFDIKT